MPGRAPTAGESRRRPCLWCGVDDEEVIVVAEAVDENVIDESALRREQRGVVGLAVFEARASSW